MSTTAQPPYTSLSAVMDTLTALEATVDPSLRVYRYCPSGQIELPAIFNWWEQSTSEWVDTGGVRDVFNLSIYVVTERSDLDEQLIAVEGYADQLRAILDENFKNAGPLNGIRRANRKTFSNAEVTFNQILTFGFRIGVELWLDRIVTP